MAIKLGLKCKAFRGTAGTTAATEMKNIKDVTLTMENGEADITTRKADGWHVYAATLKDATIEFGMLYDPEDEDLKAVSAAYFGNTPLALFISDGDGNGLDCDAMITQFNVEQPLEEGVSVSVTARPTDIGGTNGRAPAWKSATSA